MTNPLMLFFFPAEVMDSEPPSESPVTMSLCLQSGLQPVWVAVASVTSGLTLESGAQGCLSYVSMHCSLPLSIGLC